MIHQDAALDAAINELAARAFAFLERLVAAPTMLGNECEGQLLVAEELQRLGFAVEMLDVPEEIGRDPLAGTPPTSYERRPVIVARRGEGPRSLLLNGHVDVVPPGDERLWQSDPFLPSSRDGWLYGRGAGDMKAGIAMCTLALEALLEADGELGGCLTFVSALEEECTGNGTLASLRAGVVADAVLLPEPTALEVLVGGAGVLWLDVEVAGLAVHAGGDEAGVNAIEAALPLLAALKELERDLNEEHAYDGVGYRVNIGALSGGDWPSSVPASARLRVRMGFPREWTVDEAERRLGAALERAAAADAWLARRPPRITRGGLAARGYAVPRAAAVVGRLADAHRRAHGEAPEVVVSPATTDARLYWNGLRIPAICYGPRARAIHGIDEAVELESIIAGARTVARFVRSWLGGEAG